MIKKSKFAELSLILFIIYGMFYNLLTSTVFQNRKIMMFFWLFVLSLSFISDDGLKTIKLTKKQMIIILLLFACVLIRNQDFANGGGVMTLRWIFYLIYFLSIYRNKSSICKIVKYTSYIGFVHVMATWFFFFFRSTYKYMYYIWQYWPSGTKLGTYGYRAALTNHYSSNGIVLAITYISFFSLILGSDENLFSKNNRRYLACFILSYLACLLTCKRAHVLFGLLGMLFAFYVYKKEKMSNRFFKIIFTALLLLCVIIFVSPYIPFLDDFLSRFDSLEEDSTMGSRYVLWIYALQMFLNKPLFGNGWFSFTYQYRLNLYDASVRAARYEYSNVHNVYIQLLAETGIIGFSFFIILGMFIFLYSIKLLRKYRTDLLETGTEVPSIFSLTFQVFFLLYCFTGNCLYDFTAAFFFLAVAITMHISYMIRKQKRNIFI